MSKCILGKGCSKNWSAIFFENSAVPRLLSIFAPIDINAITIGPFVFCRDTISETTRSHENIHWQQYLDLFVILFPAFYYYYWFKYLILTKNSKSAYYLIPFEREAYSNQEDLDYWKNRKRFSWLKYRGLKYESKD